MGPLQMAAENKMVSGVVTLLIGAFTPLITGRGPPCTKVKPQLGVDSEDFID